LVAQAVTDSRILESGERIDETRRQAPQAPVAQAGVGLFLEHRLQIPSLLLEGMLYKWLRGKIHHVVAECPAEQELHGQIMNALGVRLPALATGLGPTMGDQVANESAAGLELLPWLGHSRIHELLAKHVPLGPLVRMTRQSESLQTPQHVGIERPG